MSMRHRPTDSVIREALDQRADGALRLGSCKKLTMAPMLTGTESHLQSSEIRTSVIEALRIRKDSFVHVR